MSNSTAFRTTLAAGCILAVLGLSSCSGDTAGPASTTTQQTSAPATSAPETSTTETAASETSTATATSAAGSTSAAATAPPADAATLALKMADNPLGSILVDGKGMTLYMFTKDSANKSVCEGQCLVAWPPLLGAPTEGDGVDDSKLGSFTRADGRVQATYNGWPLYYWMNDKKPGDATGQNVQTVWYVLDRDGEPIK